MKLVLPYPVSANRYWQSFVPKGWTRAVVHPSTEAKAYKKAIGWIAKQAGMRSPTDKPIALTFTLHPRMNKDGSASAVVLDLGNCLKVAEDALQGIVYENDKQVRSITMGYGPPITDGSLVVEVIEFVQPAVEGELPLEVPRRRPARWASATAGSCRSERARHRVRR
jgi:crossover junction endodeoxyribonuclease RusA